MSLANKINLLKFGQIRDQQVFNISKRFLSPSSLKPRTEGKHYRLWAIPGDQVRIKDILAKQFVFKWFPGLNVGIDDRRTLYALADGIMIITEDKFNPDWDNHLVREIFMVDGEKRAPEYGRYLHVIPKHRISEFKLVDLN